MIWLVHLLFISPFYSYMDWIVRMMHTITRQAAREILLKHWTLLAIVKDQSSHLMYLNIMHTITNLWKFELNRSSKLRDNNERKKGPCHMKLCAFICLISRPQILNLRYRNQIRGKLLLSRKLQHFRGGRFSQWFIPSTSPHYSLPSKIYTNNYFE